MRGHKLPTLLRKKTANGGGRGVIKSEKWTDVVYGRPIVKRQQNGWSKIYNFETTFFMDGWIFCCSIKFFKLHFSQIPIRKCWNHNANIEQGKDLPKTRGGGAVGGSCPKTPSILCNGPAKQCTHAFFSLFSGLLLTTGKRAQCITRPPVLLLR